MIAQLKSVLKYALGIIVLLLIVAGLIWAYQHLLSPDMKLMSYEDASRYSSRWNAPEVEFVKTWTIETGDTYELRRSPDMGAREYAFSGVDDPERELVCNAETQGRYTRSHFTDGQYGTVSFICARVGLVMDKWHVGKYDWLPVDQVEP